MKCKQTREVIDTTSRHTLYSDSVTSHLSACPDCHRHADGTASLLKLLNSQPRVEAPADFDFKVSMGIARAQAESINDKTSSLLNLLKAQPRVEAPADFDFRLSAGIARAQSERLNQTGFIERAWERFSRSFSLGQATAMAAAALVVATASTFYINIDKSAPAETTIATMVRPTEQASSQPNQIEVKKESETPVIDLSRISAAKSFDRGIRVKPAAFTTRDLQASDNSSDENRPSLNKVYSPKTKQVVSTDVSYGAESVSFTLAKSATFTPSL